MKSNSATEKNLIQWIMPLSGIAFAVALYFLYNQGQLLHTIARHCFK